MSSAHPGQPATPAEGHYLPGHTPAAYTPDEDHHTAAGAAERQRSGVEEYSKRSRNLDYPPAAEPLPAPVIDNHTHLDIGDGQAVNPTVQQIAETAAAAGVVGLISVGCDAASSAHAVECANADQRIRAAVAIHPNEAPGLVERGVWEAEFAEITRLAALPETAAVGETGLDYFRTPPEGIAAQKESFRRHLQLAYELGKPVQIHDRDAHEDVVAELFRAREGGYEPATVVFHCFSGDAELASICNENHWYMSFSGTATFKNARDVQAGLAQARPELVLVETDAPFLTPTPYRGRPNASYVMNYTVRFLADYLDQDLAQFCTQVMKNTLTAYGAWPDR